MGEDISTIMAEIRQEIASLKERVAKIEGPSAPATPANDVWVRPTDASGGDKYLGFQMVTADVAEFIDRAKYGINWRGEVPLSEQPELVDAIWAFIEKAKKATGTEPFVQPYVSLNMDVCFVGLLTNLFPLAGYTPDPFGYGIAQVRQYAGVSPKQILDRWLGIKGRPGIG